MTLSAEDDLRQQAVRRANAKLGFRSHAFAYLAVNGLLIAINLLTSPEYLWFAWPMLGWGIGLAAHAYSVYGAGDDLRDRMIEQEMARLRNRQPPRPPPVS